MLDLIAAIQSADPPSLVLWSLFVFAAGMYPVGFMLGSNCSTCCSPVGDPCVCTQGSLPPTVTLDVDEFSDGQTPGPPLCPITFSSCFGSGAAAHVAAPGGKAATDKGPISNISVTSGGSGYAELGRVAPNLTITGSGTGATFTPTFSTSQDACGREVWAIASIAASGGTGYVDYELLDIAASAGDTQLTAARAMLFVGRAQPDLMLPGTATGVVHTQLTHEGFYTVSSITVTDGGNGYTDGEYLTLSKAANDVTVFQGALKANVNPQTGALQSVTVESGGGHYKNAPNARVVFVTDAGSYYRHDASVPPYVANVNVGIAQRPPSNGTGASLSAVIDSNTASGTFGQITAVNVAAAGDNYLAYEWCEAYLNGVSVVLQKDGCQYFKQDCGRSFLVHYFDPSVPPTVTIQSQCNGSLATFELESTTKITNCSQMSFTAEDEDGRSVTVSPGGVPIATTCGDCDGSVLVGVIEKVQVPVNTGAWVLVSVDPEPTITLRMMTTTGNSNFSPQPYLGMNWWRTYAAARAYAYCDGQEIVVRVDCVVAGLWNASLPTPAGHESDRAEYDQIAVGATRFIDPFFLPHNVFFGGRLFGYGGEPVLELRSFGPIRGDACVGQEWRIVMSDNYPNFEPYIHSSSVIPKSLTMMQAAARLIANNNIECGPV